LRPQFPEAHNNLANALIGQGSLDEATAHCEQALRHQPDFADAQNDLSLLLLLRGDFERGWRQYGLPSKTKRAFPQPLWDGSPLEGRTILLHAEQGLGDTVHFIRYVPLVQQRSGNVIVECQPALLPLMAGIAHCGRLVAQGSPLPPFDVHAPLLALPGILDTKLNTIPAAIPYLHPDGSLTTDWRRHLRRDGRAGTLLAGIGWQGNPHYPRDRQRSIPVAAFAPLAREGVELISLQKGATSDQWAGMKCFTLDEAGAFMDTAAIMANLDLVISADTSIVHVAGALGVPVWIPLARVPDWRWLLERSDSPWYPTVRLFRQSRVGHWDDVFQRMADELKKVVSR
jgi:hypothetical protein